MILVLLRRIGALAIALTTGMALPAIAAAETTTEKGVIASLGDGQVHSFLRRAGDGSPIAIGIRIDEAGPFGLPPEPGRSQRCFDRDGNGRISRYGECEGGHAYQLPMPPQAADLPSKGEERFR